MECFLAWLQLPDEDKFTLHGFFCVGEDWRHGHCVSRLNRKKIMRVIRQERKVNFFHYVFQSDKSPNDYWSHAALMNELLAIDETGLDGVRVVFAIF